MLHPIKPILVLVCLGLLLSGCSKQRDAATEAPAVAQPQETTPAKPDETAQVNPETETMDATTAPKLVEPTSPPKLPPRENLAGKWILVLTQQGTDFQAILLDFVKASDAAASKPGQATYKVKLVESGNVLPQATLKSADIQEPAVRLLFDVRKETLDFEGSFSDGSIRGNVIFAGGRCDPARLIPTEVATLADSRLYEDSPGFGDLQNAIRSADPVPSIAEFCNQHSESPLALDGYLRILSLAKSRKLKAKEVDDFAKAYVEAASQWGTRLTDVARLNTGIILALTQFDADVSLSYLETAEKEATPEMLEVFASRIQAAKEALATARARKMLAAEDPETQERGAGILRNLRKENPFDFGIICDLADYAEKRKQTAEALALYAEIAALPMAEQTLLQEWRQDGVHRELPSEATVRLWKETNKTIDGLDAFLDAVYKERICSFVQPPADRPAEQKPGHVVLCELFTGSQCPPCVAADVAVGAAEKAYASSQFVALRYHQHIPGPDPLANPDSQARFQYYNGPGTPMVLLDGAQVEGVGGFMQHVLDAYERLQTTVDAELQRSNKRSYKIALSAQAEDGKLNISADVSANEPFADNIRLRLVLAEQEVAFVARNGIRLHDMVVRQMIGEPEGIAPQDGHLTFKGSLPLVDFKRQLVDYLADFERDRSWKFPAQPMELKPLRLVAFVQNDVTREILETAVVPVAGTLEYPDVQPTPTAEEMAKQKKDEDEKTNAKKKPEGEQLKPPSKKDETTKAEDKADKKETPQQSSSKPAGPILKPPTTEPEKSK